MKMEDIKKMKEQGFETYKNIQYPHYNMDERLKVKREADPKPPASIYKEIGFD
jgi:hypothetical protein